MTLTIGVDIGGTKVAAGLVDASGHVLTTTRRSTPSRVASAVEDVVADVIRELAAGRDVRAVGIGAAGLVDASRSRVLFAPNLAWRDEPLRLGVQERVGLPVIVENDANAAAWAEAKFGAGRGESFVIMLTVGTGLGGGIVLNGQLYRGRLGIAAEIGHMILAPFGRPCGCGNRGCWECYASGTALVQEAQELASTAPATALRLLELAGGEARGITGACVTQAALEGDQAALQAFRAIGEWLGHGMASLAAVLDAGVFIIGGGVSEAGELLREPAMKIFEDQLTARSYRDVPDVRIAELGTTAGLIGAADLARYVD
ncbi:MAG: glucokinase [Frankiales bacterium]|jgi:glucokinase|nr:glucokinase [Frankiales bacterium]